MKMSFLIGRIDSEGFLNIFFILLFEIELETNDSLIDENSAFIFIVRNLIKEIIVKAIGLNVFGFFNEISALSLFVFDGIIIFLKIFFEYDIGRIIDSDAKGPWSGEFIERFFDIEDDSRVEIVLIGFCFKRKVVETESDGSLFGIKGSDLYCYHLHGIGNGEFNVWSEMGFSDN